MEGRYKNFNGWIYGSWYVMHTKINGKKKTKTFEGKSSFKMAAKGVFYMRKVDKGEMKKHTRLN